MLKDLFSNRLFIGALAFFILCMVGGTLYIGYVEKQEGAMELAEAEERIKQLTSKQQQPTAETEPIEGKIHRRPFSEMPPEERLKAVEDWYRQSGLELPPDGYKYVWSDVGIPRRDENGNPILIKKGEPFFEVTIARGFAPTREEFAEYQQMEKDKVAAALRGDDAEVKRLSDARLRFWLEHQGEIPSVSILNRPPGVDYTEEINERLYAEYRKAGFDYLIPDEYR